MPIGAAIAPLIATGLGDLGVSAGIASVAAPIIGGAAGGALTSGLTGGNVGLGALTGGALGGLSDIVSGIGSGFSGITGDISSFFGGGADTTSSAVAVPGASGGFSTGFGSGTPVAAQAAGSGAPPLSTDVMNTGGTSMGGGATTSQLGTGGLSTGDVGTSGGGGGSGNISPIGGGGGGNTGGGSLDNPTNVTSSAGATPSIASYTGGGGSTGGLYGTNWATPSNVQTGWNQVAAGGGSPLSTGTNSNPFGSLSKALLSMNPSTLTSLFGGTAGQTNPQINAPVVNAMTNAQGMQTMLTAPSQTGVLPPGQAQALEYERRADMAAATGQAAKTGMGSSTMARDAALNVNARIDAQRVGIEDQLLGMAGTYASLANTDANNLANLQQQQQTQFNQALQNAVTGATRMAAGNGQNATGTTPAPNYTAGTAGSTSPSVAPTVGGGSYTGGGGSYTTSSGGYTGAGAPPLASTDGSTGSYETGGQLTAYNPPAGDLSVSSDLQDPLSIGL